MQPGTARQRLDSSEYVQEEVVAHFKLTPIPDGDAAARDAWRTSLFRGFDAIGGVAGGVAGTVGGVAGKAAAAAAASPLSVPIEAGVCHYNALCGRWLIRRPHHNYVDHQHHQHQHHHHHHHQMVCSYLDVKVVF